MKHYLNLFDYALWMATICLQWLLFHSSIRRTIQRQAPRFFCFTGFICVEATALLAISQLFPYRIYYWSYYAGIGIETLLLILVLYEVFRNTFDPLGVLPAPSVAKLATILLAAASLAIAIGIWKPALSYDAVTALLRTMQRTIVFLAALSLWSLVMYARSLAIPWRSRTAGIASGFLFYLTVESFARAGQGFAPQPWFAWFDRVLSVAFIMTLVMWFRAIRRPEEISLDLPAPEVLRKLNAAIAEMRTATRQLKIAQSLHPKMKEE